MAERASAHSRRKATTRDVLLNTALAMVQSQSSAPFSHESLAENTGIAARTVYRHFPTRADLTRALWERLRDEAGIQWPHNESGIGASVKALFRQFEQHSAFVRASIVAAAATDYPTHGSTEGRAAFAHSLEELLADLPTVQRQQVIAACVAVYSAPFWQMLRDRGQLSDAAAAETASWVLDAIIADVRRRAAPSTRKKTGESDHVASRSVSRSSRRGGTHKRPAQHRR